MFVSFQRNTRQTVIKGLESSDFNPLPDSEVPHNSGDRPSTRECYNKSLELAKKGPELPQAMKVETTSQGLMETNINPRLQEDESTIGHVEELTEIQVDPNEPSRVVKIGK